MPPAACLVECQRVAGDELFLTKPIGTGVISTALKFSRPRGRDCDAAVASMTTLNRRATEVLLGLPAGSVHACTDVTGFGLLGHASEVADASHCTLELDAAAIPLLTGAMALVNGNVPGGGRTNVEHFASGTRISRGLDPELVQLLCDPQTSGGLLVAVSAPKQAPPTRPSVPQAFQLPESAGSSTPPASASLSSDRERQGSTSAFSRPGPCATVCPRVKWPALAVWRF